MRRVLTSLWRIVNKASKPARSRSKVKKREILEL